MQTKTLFLTLSGLLVTSSLAHAKMEMPSDSGAIFVCMDKGDNKNANTKKTPLKNIDKALKVAKSGATILVCGGTYMGTFDIGYLQADNAVKLYGSYSPDFQKRDLFAHPTLFQPNNASGAKSRKALLQFSKEIDGTVIDGFVFDMGARNSYDPKDGRPDGVATGMLLLPPAKAPDQAPTVTEPCLSIASAAKEGSVTIRNNVFANCANNAIQAGLRAGKFVVQNNVFVANRMSAVEIYGTCRATGAGPSAKLETKCGEVDFGHNSVLFTWSRIKDFKDMGYGFRIMTGVAYNIHDNIFAGNVLGGVDSTRFSKVPVQLDNNSFFVNKEADLFYSPDSNTSLRLRAEQFGDLELASVKGNTSAMPKKYPIQGAYLEGFLSARYSEKADYDPNSPANQFREAMGLNKQGKLTTKVSMFGNQYPVADALRLFGGMPDRGAQLP